MAKLTKFQRSQRAHKRLARKHYTDNPSKNFDKFVKSDYHATILKRQEKENRVFSQEERKKGFKACHSIALNQYGW